MAKNSSNKSSFPYDDAFRTMVEKSGNLRIPFINEMFQLETPIQANTPIENIVNEYFIEEGKGKQRKIITDSVLHIAGKTYHVECQSFDDGTILVRMFEYDVSIALKESQYHAGRLRVIMPHSGVLFLRKTSDTPEDMVVTIETEGGNVEYSVAALYLADYTLDDLIEKKLLFLFPFYIFNLESEFNGFEQNEEGAREKVITSFNDLLEHVNKMYGSKQLSFEHYLLITDMLRKVTDALTQKYDNVRKELDDIMGGKVLEFKGEKIFNEGSEDRAEKIAEKMLRAGKLSDEEIADYTGLTLSQVKDLREEIKTAVMA